MIKSRVNLITPNIQIIYNKQSKELPQLAKIIPPIITSLQTNWNPQLKILLHKIGGLVALQDRSLVYPIMQKVSLDHSRVLEVTARACLIEK